MDAETLAALQAAVTRAVALLLDPFFEPLNRRSLYFWPFLLGALAVALLLHRLRHRRFRGFLRETFAPAIWGHPSARADYRYFVVNHVVFTVLFAPLVLSGAWIATVTRDGLTLVAGPAGTVAPAGTGTRLALTVAFFLAYDFGRYLAHWLLHRYPLLWEFHKVHHSAEVLTPLTNARAHPVELLLMAGVPALLTGAVVGAFMHAHGRDIGVFTYFGLHVAVFAYNLVGNLRHSHVWLSYGRVLSHLLMSPAQHQIHHSIEPRHMGRNIGFALAVWDWMFGTLYVPLAHEHFRMGLGDGTEARYHGIRGMYLEPLRALVQRGRALAPPPESR